MHSYKKCYYYTDCFSDYYEKFIEKSGGAKKPSGNQLFKYDFEILDNKIFLGDKRKDDCAHVEYDSLTKIASILFFGYKEYCSKSEGFVRGIGTRHMFLWLILNILKYFPKVKKISLGDDVKIKCNGISIFLNKYYFLKYGKMYYEYYYDFYPEFMNKREKDIYESHLELRKKIYITKKYIQSLQLQNSNFFTSIFGEKEELKIIDYLSRISEEEKFKYCESYFFIINDFFARNFGHFLPTTFSYNISKDIADKIKKNISELVGKAQGGSALPP
jgi:hypothetical protein